jgi:hypothetical protein
MSQKVYERRRCIMASLFMAHTRILTTSQTKRNMKMPQFWKIEQGDRTHWINPAHIVYVQDNPNLDRPAVWITMVAVESGEERNKLEQYTLALDGEAREKFLAYLVRETESDPPPTPA